MEGITVLVLLSALLGGLVGLWIGLNFERFFVGDDDDDNG